MPTKVLVPRLGEGVDEITVTKWLKREGESVEELEPLLEVNTDKVDTEIPSPASGTLLKIILTENMPVQVGQILAWIGEPGEILPEEENLVDTADEPFPVTAPSTPQPDVAAKERDFAPPAATAAPASPEAGRDQSFISPVVARIASEHRLDLKQITGTGLGGRITKKDVMAFVAAQRPAPAPPSPPTPPAVAPGDSFAPHTVLRRQIAERMVLSKQTVPHVLTVMEADMSHVIRHRADNQETFVREGANLTFTAYFVAAIVAGLKACPNVNASWHEDGVLIHKAINVGMATSLGEDGLIVPVIKGADGLSLLEIAHAVNDLAARARARKLQTDEVKDGTFTLTNHGVSGSLFAMPIINQAQTGILGIGMIQKRAVVLTDEDGNDSIAVRPMVYLSFVFDHRLLDGASADRFLARVKESLENWA